MIKAKFTVNIYILNIWFEFLYFYRFYSFKIGCSSDQGSPYVRLMKQIQIPGVDFTDSENEEGDRTIQLADTDGATLLDTDGDAIVDTDENNFNYCQCFTSLTYDIIKVDKMRRDWFIQTAL